MANDALDEIVVAVLGLARHRAEDFISAHAVELFGGPCYYHRPCFIAGYETIERVGGAAAVRTVIAAVRRAGVPFIVLDAASPGRLLSPGALDKIYSESAEFFALVADEDDDE